jgi:hypothetical protein
MRFRRKVRQVCGGLALAHHVFHDGGLTDVDPEFQQFAMNPQRTPARVSVRHCANQRADVSGRGRSPVVRQYPTVWFAIT